MTHNEFVLKDTGDYRHEPVPRACDVQEEEGMSGRECVFDAQALHTVRIDYADTYAADDARYSNGRISYWNLRAPHTNNAVGGHRRGVAGSGVSVMFVLLLVGSAVVRADADAPAVLRACYRRSPLPFA